MHIALDDTNVSKTRRKKTENQIWAVVWRFLLFCAIFDGGIYFYFHVIKNTTVSEGINEIRVAIHGNKSDQHSKIHKPPVSVSQIANQYSKEIYNKEPTPDNNKYENSNRNQYSISKRPAYTEKANKIYCWEDENGNRHYSNTGYPSDGYFKIVILK